MGEIPAGYCPGASREQEHANLECNARRRSAHLYRIEVAVDAVMLVCFATAENVRHVMPARNFIFLCRKKLRIILTRNFRPNFSQPPSPNRALLAAFMDSAVCQYSCLPVSRFTVRTTKEDG